MAHSTTIDFLRVILDRQEELEPPLVDLVRYYVRSGISMPSKRYMLDNDIVMVSWDFPFADKSDASFADVVLQKEPEVAPNLRKLGPFLGGEKAAKSGGGNQPAEGGGDGPAEPLMFHGIFPVRSAGGGAPSRYRVLWSGRREVVSILEEWRLGAIRPSNDSAATDAQNFLVHFLDDLLSYVNTSFGDGLYVTILDPRVALAA
jgi:hypothetical protein